MSNRHLSRSIVLQTLFEWDFRGQNNSEIQNIIRRDIDEFAPGMGDISFVEKLINNILEKRFDLDKIIEKAAPDWPIDKISITDRNILRIGLYELLFADRNEVPAKVAINESIELAKTFGGENSGKFINGVLGSVYKEIGEPGKDAVSKNRVRKPEAVPYEKIPVKKLGGAVVYAKDENGEIYLALVHDIFGHWTLSKGKIEEGEDEIQATIREVGEELGLNNLKIKEKLGENEYVASHPESGKLRKHVMYFLVESKFDEVKLEKEKGGLDDAKWFKLADILELNFYNDILPIVTKAITILSS
ncbi:MAG: transcription antitermination factor NusB [Patescibacteria group bacterium]|nr:transcription antitermination factor NusB [Patescibacteria group bacterium]